VRSREFIACLLALICLRCGGTEDGADRFKNIRADIIDFMEDENIPSVSVAVAQGGTIIWEEAFGWANREKKIEATTGTMYELASIAKVYTATAIMILRERGLVDLDAPVQQYLRDITLTPCGVDVSGVTLRRIIQHTSGLPMFWGAPSPTDTTHPMSNRVVLRRYAILSFTPGERELYSNVGIGLLNAAIEDVAHRSYADFLKQTILEPLALTRTEILSAPSCDTIFAQQYDPDGSRWTYESGFYASAHDLARFGMFHLKHRLNELPAILSDASIDIMQTSIDPHSDFRLPWWVWEYDGYRALVFTGASGTIMALLPEADLAVVVLANRLQANTPKICRWIVEEMLDDFDERQRLPTAVRFQRKISSKEVSRDSLAGRWIGSIRTPEGLFDAELWFGGSSLPRMRCSFDHNSWTGWSEPMPSLRGDYSDGIFSAYFPIEMPIAETRQHAHWTWLYVGMEGNVLRGYTVAHAAGGPYFGLPYCITLRKEPHR